MSRADEMQDLIARWEASSLSQRAFAEREGLTYSAFQYWRRRLRRSRSVKARSPRTALMPLAPVRIIPDALPTRARATPTASPAFELRTPSGHLVSVPVGFDACELRRLLEAVSAC